jgi:GGDEF domain-containing protein
MKITRKEDIVVRMGSDEFIIFVPSMQRLETTKLIKQFSNHVHNLVAYFPTHVSVSISGAVYPKAGETLI